jgi:hypothetical protein
MAVKVDIRVPVGRWIPEVVEFVRRCEEAGIDHVFLFPAHTFETGYEMPQAEVEAFGRVIGPRLEA